MKYFFIMLILFSTNALADRVLTGTSHTSFKHKAEACESAKYMSQRQKYSDEHVVGYSGCDCSMTSAKEWKCNVDAKIAKDKPCK